jgi:RNA polymerase sigma-70 factor (ECF subfamily)
MLADEQERQFRQWLGEHKNLMFKVVRAYAASPQDQDDLFQEILLHLWSSIPGFNGQAKETTWIYKVALNTALVWKRDQKRRRKGHHGLMIDFEEISDARQNCCDSIEARQLIDQVYGAIRDLPKIDSSIILMSLDGISYHEMAEILGISTSNVGVRLNRAKKQLAGLLKGLVDDV